MIYSLKTLFGIVTLVAIACACLFYLLLIPKQPPSATFWHVRRADNSVGLIITVRHHTGHYTEIWDEVPLGSADRISWKNPSATFVVDKNELLQEESFGAAYEKLFDLGSGAEQLKISNLMSGAERDGSRLIVSVSRAVDEELLSEKAKWEAKGNRSKVN